MKNLMLAILTCSLLIAGTGMASAEVTASAGADFVSKYIWRGFNLSDGPNVQPAVEVDLGTGAYAGYWGSVYWDAEDENIEHDVYLGYDMDLGLDAEYTLSVGYTYYKFPTLGDDESHEFWLGMGFNNLPLSPSLTLYFDVGDEKDGGGDGEYWLLSVSHEHELDDGLTVSLGADLGYNNKLFIDENGFADFTPSFAVSYQVNEHFSAGISLNYTLLVDSDVEDAMGADDEFWGGVNFSIS